MGTMTHNFDIHPQRAGATRRKPGVLDRLVAWQAIHSQRTALGELDARLLEDLGISAEDARKEAKRPVWQAPEHWLR